MGKQISEQISSGDWEATPHAVRSLLLSLERERNAIRQRLEHFEHLQEAASDQHKQRIERYQSLVELQFSSGLSPEQKLEIERLGEQIDGVNAEFYPTLSSLAEKIKTANGSAPE